MVDVTNTATMAAETPKLPLSFLVLNLMPY